ncbi:GGDEF domain-containing protein [uncultured Agitococcus sp.]|uniref:GGDEF domain-containing protein n=1 Tax=uncultured Agitococcus sp. TaxID=1506599 RepID=UPI0026254C01|nr:GGDEF domain-containing protein [uncultured Agitococcus sp.]
MSQIALPDVEMIQTLANQDSCWQPILHQLQQSVEHLAHFGRWWLHLPSQRLLLSQGASHLLDIAIGSYNLNDVLEKAIPLDQANFRDNLLSIQLNAYDCRVLHHLNGLRWLKVTELAVNHDIKSGVIVDNTSEKLALMRERFSFATSQFLVSAQQIEAAITKVIQLVCENLGWDWGAYWAMEQRHQSEARLNCKYYWHHPQQPLVPFTDNSLALSMGAGEGLVGTVWHTSQPSWVENMENDYGFLRRNSAKLCGLKSGYAFPISYVSSDGTRHSVGVMEFFSFFSRQQEAQLPNLSAMIGALVAQTIQRMEQQESIQQLARIDDLTGIYNRQYFHDVLDRACFKATANQQSFAVLFIDLDRFKPINDGFGHDAGNLVLQEFARRLQNLVGENSIIGRLGGDEFAILARNSQSLPELQILAEQVLLAARTPFYFAGHELTVSASVGVSVFPDNGWTSAELVRSADMAMYKSKQRGRNALTFVSEDSSEDLAKERSLLVQQITIEAELHHALVKQQFFLDYQPIFDFNAVGMRMVAVEALIRWRRANGDIVHPDVFIPIAEQSRLIVQIGRWVFKQACLDLLHLQQSGFKDLQLNVNMAALEFTNPSLPYELNEIAEQCGLAPRYLCLEITEGMIMRQPDKVIGVMRSLRKLGFKISLDDFGVGHSSLTRLKVLPISSLKIDRSFVMGLPDDRGDRAIVRTILDLGKHMHLAVVAEGVETDRQLSYLRQFGCHLIQGYVLSKPLSIKALLQEYLERHYA